MKIDFETELVSNELGMSYLRPKRKTLIEKLETVAYVIGMAFLLGIAVYVFLVLWNVAFPTPLG